MGRGKVVFTRTQILEALQLKEDVSLEQISAGENGELTLVLSGPHLPEITRRGPITKVGFYEVSNSSSFIKD